MSPTLSAVEKLTDRHDVRRFRSGKHSLDLFLKRYALKNQQVDSSQTYVVHRSDVVVGYYTLAADSVERDDCPPAIREDMPPYRIPVILLARLAVATDEQGKGLGKALLKDAFRRVSAAAEIIGARAVLVHALDQEARLFYKRYGFEEFPGNDLTLMLSLKDVRAATGT